MSKFVIECPHCGNNVVFDQSASKLGRLPAARNLTVSTTPVEWNAVQTECRGRCPHRPAPGGVIHAPR